MKYPAWLTKIPHFDKWLHAVGCLAVYAAFRAVGVEPVLASHAITLGAAWKELRKDKTTPGSTVSWADFLAGVLPTLAVALIERYTL